MSLTVYSDQRKSMEVPKVASLPDRRSQTAKGNLQKVISLDDVNLWRKGPTDGQMTKLSQSFKEISTCLSSPSTSTPLENKVKKFQTELQGLVEIINEVCQSDEKPGLVFIPSKKTAGFDSKKCQKAMSQLTSCQQHVSKTTDWSSRDVTQLRKGVSELIACIDSAFQGGVAEVRPISDQDALLRQLQVDWDSVFHAGKTDKILETLFPGKGKYLAPTDIKKITQELQNAGGQGPGGRPYANGVDRYLDRHGIKDLLKALAALEKNVVELKADAQEKEGLEDRLASRTDRINDVKFFLLSHYKMKMENVFTAIEKGRKPADKGELNFYNKLRTANQGLLASVKEIVLNNVVSKLIERAQQINPGDTLYCSQEIQHLKSLLFKNLIEQKWKRLFENPGGFQIQDDQGRELLGAILDARPNSDGEMYDKAGRWFERFESVLSVHVFGNEGGLLIPALRGIFDKETEGQKALIYDRAVSSLDKSKQPILISHAKMFAVLACSKMTQSEIVKYLKGVPEADLKEGEAEKQAQEIGNTIASIKEQFTASYPSFDFDSVADYLLLFYRILDERIFMASGGIGSFYKTYMNVFGEPSPKSAGGADAKTVGTKAIIKLEKDAIVFVTKNNKNLETEQAPIQGKTTLKVPTFSNKKNGLEADVKFEMLYRLDPTIPQEDKQRVDKILAKMKERLELFEYPADTLKPVEWNDPNW